MGKRTTTAGRVKVGLALDPQAYDLLQEMASGPRGLGSLLSDLVRAEAERRRTGAPVSGQVVAYDVTERRQAADELREQSERLSQVAGEQAAILDAIADGLVIYDKAGQVTRMNRAAERILGYSMQEGRPVVGEVANRLGASRPNGQVYPRAEYPVMRALRGETVQGDVMVLHRPDGDIWISSSAAPVVALDGSLSGAVATFTDTTPLHETQQHLEETYAALEAAHAELQAQATELAEANGYLEAILSAVPSGLIVYDVEGRTLRASQAARSMVGWNPGRWERPVAERAEASVQFRDLREQPLPRDRYPALRALSGETLSSEEYRVHFPDHPDSDLWATFSAGPILADGGQVTGALVTWVDTSALHEATGQLAAANTRLEMQAEELRRAADQLREGAASLEQRVRERTAELLAANRQLSESEATLQHQRQRLELLHEIDRSILVARAPADIALAAIDKLVKAMVAQRATVVLIDFATGTGEILAAVGPQSPGFMSGSRVPLNQYPMIERVQAGEVVMLEDMARLSDTAMPTKGMTLQAGLRSATLLPLIVEGEVIGLLSVTVATPGPLGPDLLEMAAHVADSLAVAIHNARLNQRLQASHAQLAQRGAALQALSRRLVERQENERSYVADRLYNEAAQVIAALKWQADMFGPQAPRDGTRSEWISELSAKMDEALVELHRLAGDLRPAILDRLGLAPAVRRYCAEFEAKHRIATDVNVERLVGVRLPAEIETCAYRVMQEALSNAATHSHASRVAVTLTLAEGKLRLRVKDNGVGFDVAEAQQRGGPGLVGMRERADAVAGRLELESAAGHGTTVILEIPES